MKHKVKDQKNYEDKNIPLGYVYWAVGTGSQEFLTVVFNLCFWKSLLGEVSTVLLIATKKFYKLPGNLISHLAQNSRQICKQVFQTVLNLCSTEI